MNVRLDLDRYTRASLEEVVSEAALLTRVDRKYLLPLAAARDAIEEETRGARILEICGRRSFAYDSVYFDTEDHLSYRLTAQRRRRRFKIRTRTYIDTGSTYLELKTKSGRGSTVKERMEYRPSHRRELTREGRVFLASRLVKHAHDAALVDDLRPSLVSQYERITLVMTDGSRVTIDQRLRWHDRNGTTIALPEHLIIESKSLGRPNRLDRALWRAGHRPSGISKFGTGTAALHPELPSNKWSRTLDGPFRTSAHIA